MGKLFARQYSRARHITFKKKIATKRQKSLPLGRISFRGGIQTVIKETLGISNNDFLKGREEREGL